MALMLGKLPVLSRDALFLGLRPLAQGNLDFFRLPVSEHRKDYCVARTVIVGQMGNELAGSGDFIATDGNNYVAAQRVVYTIYLTVDSEPRNPALSAGLPLTVDATTAPLLPSGRSISSP